MLRRRMIFGGGIEDGGGNDENCILLLHFDNNRTDDSQSNMTISQDNTIPYTTTYKKFGTHALNCTAAFFKTPDNIFSTLVLFDFTVDYWVKVNNTDSGIPDFSFQGNGAIALDRTVSLACFTGGIRVVACGKNNASQPVMIDNTVSFSWNSDFNHVAVVRKNDVLKVFINGALIASYSFAVTQFGYGGTYPASYFTENKIAGGLSATSSGNIPTNNVMDEFRVSDCARWSRNFTPPTAAYTLIDVEDNGGNDANCITLLHLDNGVINSSAISQTWTKNNYTLYSSSIKKFGTHGIYDQYRTGGHPMSIGVTQTTGFLNSYLDGDWTAEAWIYIPTGSYYDSNFKSVAFCLGCKTGTLRGYLSLLISNGKVSLLHSTDGSAFDFDTDYACTIPRTEWFHLAAVKKDGVLSVYIDGIKVVGNVTWNYSQNSLYTLSYLNVYSYLYMDEFRFSNCARWTKRFIPPTAAYV